MTTKEIGHYLSLSERTVERYRRNIIRNLNAKTLAGVIKFAIQNGVVMPDEF